MSKRPHGQTKTFSTAAAAQQHKQQQKKHKSHDYPCVEDNFVPADGAAIIGNGTFGLVRRAIDLKQQGKLVALKVYNSDQNNYHLLAMREIDTLKRLRGSPYVVEANGTFQDKDANLYLSMELASYDLLYLIKDKQLHYWSLEQMTACMFQIASGVKFIHDHRLMHRDLKPENILCFAKQNLFKICDFGMVNNLSYKKYTNPVTTLWYRDPQLLLETQVYGAEVDMWSLACIFGTLLFETYLFPGESESHQLSCIWALCGTPTMDEVRYWPVSVQENLKIQIERYGKPRSLFKRIGKNAANMISKRWFNEHTIDLLDKMLTLTPCKRMTADKVLEHAFFKPKGGGVLEPFEMVLLPARSALRAGK